MHKMLATLRRETSAERINAIVNHPSVYPFVRGHAIDPLDVSSLTNDPANVLLVGEHGGLLFHQVAANLYEAHTSVLPAGRGAWAIMFAHAALHWMFSRTLAMEIFTRVPQGNKGALGLVRAIHGRFEFERQNGWIMDFDPVPAGIYTRSVADWMRNAPGLAERGAWFHDRLEAEYARHGRQEPPHDDDTVHDRYVGAATEMILGGQPDKGVLFYNRWALMAGYQPVQIIARSPLTIDIKDAFLIVRDDDFWVPAVR